MFSFNSIKELIEALYKERDLIDSLFSKRKSLVSYENALSLVDFEEEKLQSLLDKSILIQEGNSIEVNADLIDFFEKFTDTAEEINVEYTSYLLRTLNEHINLYEKEQRKPKKEQHLLQIKRNLRSVGKDILRNVNLLRDKVEDVYATEKVYTIKKIKLNDYDSRRENIDGLMGQIDQLMQSSNWDFFMKITHDDQLLKIVVQLQKDLNIARKNLIDITQKILDFLNQVKQNTEMYKHLQQIKKLKDHFQLKEKTDFEKIITADNSLLLQNKISFSTNLSISFLQSDEALNNLIRVSNKIKEKKELKSKVADEIGNEFFENLTKSKFIPNRDQIKQGFLSQSVNLFDFLLHYKFNEEVSEEDRITLFCEIASLYRQEFEFVNEYKEFKNIEYSVVLPK